MLFNIEPADRVVIPKSSLNLVQHHGIYAGRDILGQDWFLENNCKNGVQYSSSEDFFNDVSVDKIEVRPFHGGNQERQAVLEKAKSKIGKRYNLFIYNCEHYCNEVQFGKVRSIQIIVAIIVAALTFLLIRSYSKSYNC